MGDLVSIRRADAGLERRILTGMIVSDTFLSRLSAADFNEDLFQSEQAQLIARWALDYYRQYSRAPKKELESVFLSWARQSKSGRLVELVQKTLISLSEGVDLSGDSLNIDFLLDESEEFFNRRKLTMLAEDIQNGLMSGDSADVEQYVTNYHRMEMSQASGVDPLRDMSVLRQVFEEKAESLVRFPGALGDMLNDYLVRDSLIAFQAPEKTGKSWMLMEMLYRALRSRKTVAYFDAGDMSQRQVMMRFYVRLTGMPMRKKDLGEHNKPIKIYRTVEGDVETETRRVMLDKSLNYRDGRRAAKRFMEKILKVRDRSLVKIVNHPNGSISVAGIESQLDSWVRNESFVPDVIIIDYADILAPENKRGDMRDQINETWMALRRLSQRHHCLVVTATQADAQSYTGRVQSMRNFSEDKRKNAHVTGMIGLNQTEEEKEQGIIRLNWIALREGEFSNRRVCYVAQDLKLGRAYVSGLF